MIRPTDVRWLRTAIDLSRRCPPSTTAYSVGAILVSGTAAGVAQELARGYSRERNTVEHAEEVALDRIGPADPRLRAATLYSTMEPCSVRRSRPLTCTELVIAAGVPRVVFALREPPDLADCDGAELLTAAGVEVVEIVTLAGEVRAVNAAVLTRQD